MVLTGGVGESCPRTFAFFRLMVSPKFLQAYKNVASMPATLAGSDCNSSWVWDATAASAAKKHVYSILGVPHLCLGWEVGEIEKPVI